MKKVISVALCLMIAVAAAGCGGDGGSGQRNNRTGGVEDVLEEEMAKADGETSESAARQNGVSENAPPPEVSAGADEALSATEGVDVDLTSLTSNMVYAEVYNMMITPGDYMGKTIRMSGSFSSLYDEAADKRYFACIVRDAMACCAQGIEFTLTDDYAYPDDYPQEGEDITVTGVFGTYTEGELTYCTLSDSVLS